MLSIDATRSNPPPWIPLSYYSVWHESRAILRRRRRRRQCACARVLLLQWCLSACVFSENCVSRSQHDNGSSLLCFRFLRGDRTTTVALTLCFSLYFFFSECVLYCWLPAYTRHIVPESPVAQITLRPREKSEDYLRSCLSHLLDDFHFLHVYTSSTSTPTPIHRFVVHAAQHIWRTQKVIKKKPFIKKCALKK